MEDSRMLRIRSFAGIRFFYTSDGRLMNALHSFVRGQSSAIRKRNFASSNKFAAATFFSAFLMGALLNFIMSISHSSYLRKMRNADDLPPKGRPV